MSDTCKLLHPDLFGNFDQRACPFAQSCQIVLTVLPLRMAEPQGKFFHCASNHIFGRQSSKLGIKRPKLVMVQADGFVLHQLAYRIHGLTT